MEKQFNKFFIANLKRTYQMLAPIIREKQKLVKEIEEKTARIDELCEQMKSLNTPIETATGGYGVEDLVERVVITTDKFDKNNNPVKITKFVLKYPETVVPVQEPEVSEPQNIEAADNFVADNENPFNN